MNRSSGGRTRLGVTRPEGIKTCTTHTIEIKGHTTEQCRVLKDHLGQLVKARYLKEFVVDSDNRDAGHGAQ